MAVNEQAVTTHQPPQARNGVRLKSIALPAEHGGWGFVFEPVVLGLLLAPSAAGFYLALSAVGFFLARHPLTLVVLSRKRQSPRTALAKRFALLYLAIGATSFVAAVVFTQRSFILPLLIAAPLASIQVAHDWSGRRRVLLSELAGAIAISSLAAAIALSGGFPKAASFALWAIMIARALPSILYVRAILDKLHKRLASPLPMLFAHALAVIAVAIISRAAVPAVAIAAMVTLLVRASIVFAVAPRIQLTAKQLGFSEIAFGAITVFTVIFGYGFGI